MEYIYRRELATARPRLAVQLLDVLLWGGVVALSVFYFLGLNQELGSASLWHDEGLTWLISRGSLSTGEVIAGAAAVDHPPLYFLIVHGVVVLLGDSERVLRLPSALSVAAVLPLVYGLALEAGKSAKPGRLLGLPAMAEYAGKRMVGLAAVALLVRHPFLWQYGLEARMYALLSALAVASAWSLFLLCRVRSWPAGLLYALTTTALLYTHYYAVLFVLAQWLVVAGSPGLQQVLRTRNVKANPLLYGLALPVLCFLPWLPVVIRVWVTQRQDWRPAVSPLYALTDVLVKLSWGQVDWRTEGLVESALLLLGLALAGAGFLAVTRQAGLKILALASLPVLLISVGTLVRPLYVDRYLLYTLPFWALLAGAGLMMPGRLLACGLQALIAGRGAGSASNAGRMVSLTAVCASSMIALLLIMPVLDAQRHYVVVVKEDWRAIAGFIAAQGASGDLILAYNDSQWEDDRDSAFRYYYERIGGRLPVRALPSYPVTQESAYRDLAAALQDAGANRRVWVLDWSGRAIDPHGWAVSYLQNSLVVENVTQFSGPIAVAELRVPQNGLHLQLDSGQRIEANLSFVAPEGQLLLHSLTYLGKVQAGDTLHVRLLWSVTRPLPHDYAVFVHLITPANVLYSGVDHQPLNDFYRISKWQPGEELSDTYDIAIPPGTPPGSYRIEVGVYARETFQKLPVKYAQANQAVDGLALEPERVMAPVELERNASDIPLERYGIITPLALQFSLPGDPGKKVDLVGATLRREGESVFITLFWKPLVAPGVDVETAVAISESGRILVTLSHQAVDGVYPTGRWQAGEIVREVYRLVVPQASGEQRTLQVGFGGQVVTVPVQVP